MLLGAAVLAGESVAVAEAVAGLGIPVAAACVAEAVTLGVVVGVSVGRGEPGLGVSEAVGLAGVSAGPLVGVGSMVSTGVAPGEDVAPGLAGGVTEGTGRVVDVPSGVSDGEAVRGAAVGAWRSRRMSILRGTSGRNRRRADSSCT